MNFSPPHSRTRDQSWESSLNHRSQNFIRNMSFRDKYQCNNFLWINIGVMKDEKIFMIQNNERLRSLRVNTNVWYMFHINPVHSFIVPYLNKATLCSKAFIESWLKTRRFTCSLIIAMDLPLQALYMQNWWCGLPNSFIVHSWHNFRFLVSVLKLRLRVVPKLTRWGGRVCGGGALPLLFICPWLGRLFYSYAGVCN